MAGTSNVLLGLVFFIICVSLPNANSFKIQCRMVNGQNVKTNNQFPFMVSLFDNRVRTHIFGGAIISQRHILSNTLNSYYKTKPMFVSAFIGSTRFLGKDGVIKNITDIFLHPKEDLALLKTLDDIVFTDSIKAIALPTESFNGVGEKVQMPGFGAGFVSIFLCRLCCYSRYLTTIYFPGFFETIFHHNFHFRHQNVYKTRCTFHTKCKCMNQLYLHQSRAQMNAIRLKIISFARKIRLEKAFANEILGILWSIKIHWLVLLQLTSDALVHIQTFTQKFLNSCRGLKPK